LASTAIFSEPDDNDVSRAQIGKRLSAVGIKQNTLAENSGSEQRRSICRRDEDAGRDHPGLRVREPQFRTARGRRKVRRVRIENSPPGPGVYSIVRQAPGKSPSLIDAVAYQPPFATLNDAAHSVGYFDVDADADGEIRTQMTVIKFDGKYCVPMFLAVADAYAGDAPADARTSTPTAFRRCLLPECEYLSSSTRRMLINSRRGEDPFPYYSVSDVINHLVAPAKTRGKDRPVGATAHGLGDRGVLR